jgi:hypothetical protein
MDCCEYESRPSFPACWTVHPLRDNTYQRTVPLYAIVGASQYRGVSSMGTVNRIKAPGTVGILNVGGISVHKREIGSG